MLNFSEICDEYSLSTANIGDSYFRPNWLNVKCPFCGGSDKHHLGFSLDFNYFNCWVCGKHSNFDTIKELLGLETYEVSKLLKRFEGESTYVPEIQERTGVEICQWPLGTVDLQPQHLRYLREERAFDTDYLKEVWKVKGTIGIGGYANRVMIPIYFKNKLCSYQGRAVGKSNLRYKACEKANEVVEHQKLLYGFDYAIPHEQCVIVEGVFDCWRLGKGAISVFGIVYSNAQVCKIAKNFKKVYILFDSEEGAQIQANNLKSELEFRGVTVEIITIQAADPAEMKVKEAKELMQKLGFKNE